LVSSRLASSMKMISWFSPAKAAGDLARQGGRRPALVEDGDDDGIVGNTGGARESGSVHRPLIAQK
jgi:hypothetical protein